MVPSTKQIYNDQGFIIVRDLIPVDSRKSLEEAADRAIARTRSGSWKLRRTVGRQFPPYGDDDPDSWGVQHVMHPELREPAFAQWYTSDPLVNVVKELLGCQEDELQMELFNMLINPESHAFALRWHRDDVRESAADDEEWTALGIWHHGVQWNTALYTDSCLYVVPGSHKVPRTPAQRAHSSTLDPPTNPMDMPGAIQVTLQRMFGISQRRFFLAYCYSRRDGLLQQQHPALRDVRPKAASRHSSRVYGRYTWRSDSCSECPAARADVDEGGTLPRESERTRQSDARPTHHAAGEH